MDVADFATEMPRRPSRARMARMVSVCAAGTLGQLALPGEAFGNSSEAKCWFAGPHTFRARQAVILKNLMDPDKSNDRLNVKKRM